MHWFLINPESVGRDVWSKMEEKQGEQSTNELRRQLSNYRYVDPTWTLQQLQEWASEYGIDVRSICGTGSSAWSASSFLSRQILRIGNVWLSWYVFFACVFGIVRGNIVGHAFGILVFMGMSMGFFSGLGAMNTVSLHSMWM